MNGHFLLSSYILIIKISVFCRCFTRFVSKHSRKIVFITKAKGKCNLLNRIRFILKRIDIKGWDGKKADLYDILKNTAGNYGIDDYNATLTIK